MTTPPSSPPAITGEEIDRQKKEARKDNDRRATISASSELLFVVLPFVVIGITLAHRGELRTIFFIPEWSIVSAVILGQTIVKLTSAAVGKVHVDKEFVILAISVLLVGLLVPVLIILAITLTSTDVSSALAGTQAIFFIVSIMVFWFASWIDKYGKP